MIVKLVKGGGYRLHVEADSVLQQVTASGCIDLEICRGGVSVKRVLIGETSEEDAHAVGQTLFYGDKPMRAVVADFNRAYLVEGGKTVDTIRREPKRQ